ncbi:MAG: hypothetical protein K0Q62_68 [Phenylobacterium sp.]|nr:hypothetical protein [Phenylobacterium sp.]
MGVSGLAITKWAPQSRALATALPGVWPAVSRTGAKQFGSMRLRRSHSTKS